MVTSLYSIKIYIKTKVICLFFLQIERIAAPTLASVRHSKFEEDPDECPKKQTEDDLQSKVPQSRRWWNETAHHLKGLRSSLVRQKILPPIVQSSSTNQQCAKSFVNTLIHKTCKIDEIVANSTKSSSVPVFPKLHLTRVKPRRPQHRCPVTVTILQFPPNETY